MARSELEFFILSIVYEQHEHLSIFETPELGMAVNRHPPEFTREELIETLSDMFCGGDLIALRDRKNSRPFIPTREEIDAGLCGALDIGYGLTRQGGARWEKMSQFDWNYHVGGWFEDGFEGPSREMIEAYLTWTRSAVPGSETWKVVRPWKATYWKSLPKGVRVQYRDAPQNPSTNQETGDLWVDEWNRRRHAEMQVFIPMNIGRTEPETKTPWRIQFRSVGQRKKNDLPHLLDNADSAVQYAAGMRLVRIGDSSLTATLIEWFLRRRRRFALRVISRIHDPRALEALVEVFKTEAWDDKSWDTPFRRDLRLAIGAFGGAAVPKLATLLRSEMVKMQVAVLEALGETGSEDPGTPILSWLETLKEDDVSNEHLQDVALTILAKLGDIRAVPLLARLIYIKAYRAVKPLILLNHPHAWKVLEDFVQCGARTHDRRLAARHMSRVNPSYQEQYERLDREAHSYELCLETIRFAGGGSTMDIGNPIKALIATLEDSDPRRRVGAISLICRNEGEFPKERITCLLDDPESEVRANAAYALGLRGSESDVPKIQRLTSDSSGLVRYCAGEALKHLSLSSI